MKKDDYQEAAKQVIMHIVVTSRAKLICCAMIAYENWLEISGSIEEPPTSFHGQIIIQ